MTAAPTKDSHRFLRVGVRAALVAVFVTVAGVAWLVYRGVSAAFHAEMALHATNEACGLTTMYVQQHKGAWPRSWHDLEQIRFPPEPFNVFPWPEESMDLQQYVEIDFTADPDRLATESVDEFEAIKPIGPYFLYKQDGLVASLLEALRAE